MAKVYYNLIKKGIKTLEDIRSRVPSDLFKEIKAMLDADFV